MKMNIHDKWLKSFSLWFKNNTDNHGDKTAFAKKIGISQPFLANILAGRRGTSEDLRKKISEIIGIPYNVMIGSLENDPINNYNSTVDNGDNIEHINIIRRFNDQETALKINKLLLKLEIEDPETGLKRVLKFINGELELLGESEAPENSRSATTGPIKTENNR